MITISQHGPRLWLLGRGYFLRVSFAALLHGEVAGACSAGADGTAGGAVGAAGDARLPDVPGGALPPDFFVAGWGDLVGREGAVQGLLPLARESGIAAGEVVETCQDFVPAAIGAACAAEAAGGCGLPGVAPVALPPDLAVAVGRDLLRREDAILFKMPLGGKGGMARGEVVLSGHDASAGANGTAPACDPAGDARLPDVALIALPPDLALAACTHIAWCEGAVLFRMPLSGNVGVGGGEVVHPWFHLPAGAHRTASAAQGAGLDCGLPGVALRALPPDAPRAASADILRREGAVFLRVPLACKGGMGGGEVVHPRLDLTAAAHGTTAVVRGARADGGFPGVPPGTAPMHALFAAIADGLGRARAIGGTVPLGEQMQCAGADAIITQALTHRAPSFMSHRYQQNKHFVER